MSKSFALLVLGAMGVAPFHLASSAMRACTKLAHLEWTLASLSSGRLADLETRLSALDANYSAWGWTGSHLPEEVACRVESLGKSLCRDAPHFLSASADPMTTAAGQWPAQMVELRRHMTNESDCAQFDRSVELRWNREMLHWHQPPNDSGKHEPTRIIEAMRKMPPSFAAAGLLPVGPQVTVGAFNTTTAMRRMLRDAAMALRGAGAVKAAALAEARSEQGVLHASSEPLSHITHFELLRRSCGLSTARLGLVVEFGGGTGALGSVLRALGFRGVHVVLDLPPMLLLQRYWLRYAGEPAYLLGVDVPKDLAEAHPSLMRGRHVLDTAHNHSGLVPRLLDAAATGGASLFIATFSFTESPTHTRQEVRPLIKRFDYIFIAMNPRYESTHVGTRSVMPYLARFIREDLILTHTVCAWDNRLVAVRRGPAFAEVSCNNTAHCASKRLPLPMTCTDS